MRAGAIFAVALLTAGCEGEPLYDGRFCTVEAPCPDGFSCGLGVCHRLCSVNEDCVLEGEVCVSGLCTGLSAGDGGTTGGLDGGANVADTGTPDANPAECAQAGDCDSPGPCEEAAGATCDRGTCVYRRLECVDPPAAECVDGDALFQSYSDIGVCNEATNACEYTSMGVPCADCVATCLEPCAAVTCDDNNGGCRTSGFCMPGLPGEQPTCMYEDADEGTECTKDDGTPGVCSAGECVQCTEAADCDDSNPCTTDVCDTAAGSCNHTPKTGACDDGNACTETDVCMNGTCVGADPVDCTTGAPECRQNAGTCNPATGACEYPPSAMGTACSSDGFPCTSDVCDGQGACVHPNRSNGTTCDDSNECTQSDVCMNGACVGTDPVECSGGAPACFQNAGTCNPTTGACEYPPSPNGTSCNDSNACTQTDTCQNGGCTGANLIACNTPPGQCYEAAGSCAPATGACSYPPSPSTRSCNDSNACTHTDRCDGSGGCGGTAYSCNDSNACTNDACNGAGGCTYARIAPANLNPSGGAVVSTMDVTMTWRACADAASYEIEIDFLRSDGAWGDYFTYTNEPANSKTFYPCSNAAPGRPCNGDFRFRVRSHNGASFGPWSPFVIWHWNNCRAC
jgi:hypothetical protein